MLNRQGGRRAILIAALLLCAPIGVQAGKEDGGVWVIGLGNESCGKYLDAVDHRGEFEEDMFVQWVLGFVVGRNVYASGNAQLEGASAAKHFTRKYCRENPLAAIMDAASELVRQLGPAPPGR
jgi:hypothetical protein